LIKLILAFILVLANQNLCEIADSQELCHAFFDQV